MHLPDPPLCLISDERADLAGLSAVVAAACEAGCRWVQLRQRCLGGRQLAELARSLSTITTAHDALLVINDRVDVALAVGADGVHLPTSGFEARDLATIAAASERSSPSLLVGRSVHSCAEISALERQPIDYFQFGPVFATASKAGFGPPQGLQRLAAAVAASATPVVAVGGINADNTAQVMATGAAGVAVISAIMDAADVTHAVEDILAALARGRQR